MIYFAWATITMAYPIEYREGATQVLTQFLLDGKNPWGLDTQPLAMNNNGFLYNLAVLPVVGLYGNTLLAHRFVSFVFLLLCAYLAARTAFASNRAAGLAMVCGELVLMVVGARGGLGVYPNSMGAFFFLMGIIVPFRRGFERKGLIYSVFLCLLAFYTKPYFVLCFAIVASYVFVCVSKKRALLYSLLFASVLVASALPIRALFPFFFVYTMISNASNTAGSLGHLAEQLIQLGREFYPSLVGACALLVAGAAQLLRGVPATRAPFSKSNILRLDRPLLSQPLNYFAYACACSTLAFVSVLGWHRGAYMTYSYQLMVPPFLLWLFQSSKLQTRLGLIVICALLLNALSFAVTRFAPSFLQQRTSAEWARLYAYTDASRRILNSPIIVPEMLRIGMPPVNSGKNEYFWNIKPYPDIDLVGPHYEVVLRLRHSYEESIRDAFMHLEYDKIITAPKADFFIPDRLSQLYARVDTLWLPMPQTEQLWRVDIWAPKAPVGPPP
jgi:hypothetical protein